MTAKPYAGYDLIQFAGGGPLGVPDYLGTDDEVRLGEPSKTFDQRITRCYELAAFAVVFGTAGPRSMLVHGSWHGPGAEQRIGHAWVELHGGLIWEPIHAAVFDAAALTEFARLWPERHYDKPTATRMVESHRDWGRWHESRYP